MKQETLGILIESENMSYKTPINTESCSEEEKINVVIDETSMQLIQNSKIDYVHELIGSSFKITNPQASSSCGCGTSFSI